MFFFVLCSVEAETLDSREIVLEEKTITIDLKSNEQGFFLKFVEHQSDMQRGRIVMSAEKAREFRSILNEFVGEYGKLPEEEKISGSERLKTYVLWERFYVVFFLSSGGNDHSREGVVQLTPNML